MRRNPNPHQRRGASLRRVAVAMVAGFACLAVVAGCSSAGGSANSGSQSRFVAGDGSVVLLPVDERKPAPDITGTTLTGEPFALAVGWCS